ncbi:MAG: hypothetical protein BWY85_01897 [Firmicutes bacterium ADurb.Bin506]|jgi:uncharacterized ferredoxin-like protein|nr:MAG: hypothetical protein BWY85_01897 [Firmicutes bacterium ADurb.Bin506]
MSCKGNDLLEMVAGLMELSAVTAPKAAGKNYVVTKVVAGEDLARLADAMVAYGVETGKGNFDRDARGVAAAGAVLLIGLKDARVLGQNCGACGFSKCADLPSPVEGPEFSGPYCAWRLIDLGIATGSAVKTASIHNIDNRIMYRIGVIARKLGMFDADIALGVPLSATGKSIYFDR